MAVDRYLDDTIVGADAALEAALASSAAADLPAISVSPSQGKLLHVIAKAMGARRILELGTLGGYSAIWLARALPPGGRLVTIEADPKHADVARRNLERAGVAAVVDLRVGAALDVLPQVQAERSGPFDFVFIDADKANYPQYLDWAIRLSRPGSLIVADNVIRKGAVIEAGTSDTAVAAMRRMMAQLQSDPRVTATAIQTVGVKGYDGFAAILVT
jgi:predicted O-methyltransferase YrrM